MDPLDEPFFSTHQHAHTQQQYWARWEYSPEEWKRFERLDWTTARHTLWLLVSVAITVGLVIALNSMTQRLSPKDASNAFTFEVFLVGLFIVMLASIGSSCIFLVQDASMTLTRSTLFAEPLALHFRRRHGRTLITRTSAWYDTMHILLPSGREQEAELLFPRFPQETILAPKRKYVPVESL